MNCSTTTSSTENQVFLSGNVGASVFMASYIGLYGFSMIVYYIFQFMTEPNTNEMSSEFFVTFRRVNEQQEIYHQLINQNWLKKIYKIYYSEQYIKSEYIDEKISDCMKKYHQKLIDLHSRHRYYVTEISSRNLILK